MRFETIIHGTKVEPRPYQKRIAQKTVAMFSGEYRNSNGDLEPNARSVMVESPTGCLAGDTLITVNLGGKSKTVTMREAYLHFHGGDSAAYGYCICGCGQKTRVPTKNNVSKNEVAGVPKRFVDGHQSRVMRWNTNVKIRSYRGERGIGLTNVENIVKSGIKTVYQLTLNDGKLLTGTACHPILTTDGWVPLGELTDHHYVLVDVKRPTVGRFGNSMPCTSAVRKVEEVGEQMTYDVCCEQPYHTFIANGIVAHNSGKTITALVTAKLLQARHPDLHVGWVAMRRNLLAQAKRENDNKGINVRNIDFISMFDRAPVFLLNARKEGKRILLVVDEAQHDSANSMVHIHNTIEPEMILGLSATPFRTDRIKLCFDKVVKDAGIHQLIQDKYLAEYDHYTIPHWTPECVGEHYCADPARWGKSIFYFKNLAECWELHRYFNERGIANEVVTGDTDWASQLAMFSNGSIPCLINCMKLTEGLDEPSLHTAWVRDSGKGCTMQMGGRVFRQFGDLVKQIVQSKKTRWPFMRTALPRMQYLWQENEWRSLTVNPKLNQINRAARRAIAQTEVNLPTWITSRKNKQNRRLRF